ncbi:phenylacetate--CoA ligase family protein [Sphaerisporangium corydalis]|uniref:Phenylacetate--CoA ligase family protein n=1 Tax=Sphaerisporangium corydalis TaxID=1441875 RepID=A0ABV9ELX3_9ACTN|nr:hypothetical protein [Sphaerisporangium corydalis]
MGESVLGLWRDIRRARSGGPEAMARRRRARLAELVAYARARSPYYRELYRHLPDRVEDPAMLPVTGKSALMPRFDDWVTDREVTLAKARAFVANPALAGERFLGRYLVATTSGTTGSPGIFVMDDRAVAVSLVLAFRMRLSWLGADGVARVLARGGRIAEVVVTGGHSMGRAGATRLGPVGRAVRIFSVHMPLPELVAELNRFRPAILLGYGSMIALLATEQTAGRLRIDPVLVDPGGETLTENDRTQISTAFSPNLHTPHDAVVRTPHDANLHSPYDGKLRTPYDGKLRSSYDAMVRTPFGAKVHTPSGAKVRTAYGAKVRTAYGATECTFIGDGCAHGWYHVNGDWVIAEPVDADHRPVPPGEPSHTVLLTNLANRVQPILRYDLGDGVLTRPDPCPCGDPLPAIRVQGRAADLLAFPTASGDPTVLAPLQFATLLDRIPGIEQFQLLQTTPSTLRVRLTLAADATPDHVWQTVRTDLTRLLTTHGLPGVTLERAEEPPQRSPGGKHRTIVPLPPGPFPPDVK